MSFIGIDLGTSGLRALLIDDQGHPIASTEQSYDTLHKSPGWSEQNPQDWIKALGDAIEQLKCDQPAFAHVRGLGISGHMHGAVLLDSNDEVLRNCILWNDARSATEAQKLDQMASVRSTSGNMVFPGFTAPKLDWLRTHEPKLCPQIDKVLLPAGYLSMFQTGSPDIDMSDASGTSWLDVGARNWSDTLLEAGHMRRNQMPRLVEGSAKAGSLRADLAKSWGLSRWVVVTAGVADNAATACGVGATEDGAGFVSLGTSGVVLVARDQCAPMPETSIHTYCHAIPDRWYQMGVLLSATDSLNWLSRITAMTPTDLTRRLGDELRPPTGVLCRPYFSGARGSQDSKDQTATFVGLTTQTTLDDLTQAILEGVAFGLRDCLETLRRAGPKIDVLYLVGGGASSGYWVKLIATVFGMPIRVPRGGEFGSALGAARLAILATIGASKDDIMHAPVDIETIHPDGQLTAAFDAAYDRFRSE